MNPSQKIALVTGASRGIGAAIAQALAREGHAVVVNYASQKDKADEVVAGIRGEGGTAVALQADVADPAAVHRMFDAVASELGGLDILINNAAMNLPRPTPLAEMEDAVYEQLMGTNVRGVFNTLREAGRRLREGGRIVNLSTSALQLALPGYGVYAASKAAVEAMTSIFAKELRGKSITVNAVSPGPTATEMFYAGKSEEVIHRFAQQCPLERIAEPADIARVVVFLVGPEGGWINGQILRANGGLV